MSSRANQITGVNGIGFYPDRNKTYPYIVKYQKKYYGAFATLEQAKEYLTLVKLALDGNGEMPPPADAYKRSHGWTAKRKTQRTELADLRKEQLRQERLEKIKRCCMTCKWRSGLDSSKSVTERNLYCKYSFPDEHHTRLYLHYQRTGTQDPKTLTHGKDCTEWEPRDI